MHFGNKFWLCGPWGLSGEWGFPHFHGPLGMLLTLVFFIFAGYLVLYLFKSLVGSRADEETVFEVIRQRYAKGEITEQEFKQLKTDLKI